MDFSIYCDESYQDLLTNPSCCQYFLIGSLWLPTSIKKELKDTISTLRKKHSAWGEIKWSKISPSKKNFYLDLIDTFIEYRENLRFRCIAINSKELNINLHNNDKELGFYKLYYQLLHHWILDYNSYAIFCDTKTNRDPSRLNTLHECLNNSNLTSKIKSIQALPSHEVVLIQLADLLLGVTAAKFNKTTKSTAKLEIIKHIEQSLGFELKPTSISEQKFNIFKINSHGGW